MMRELNLNEMEMVSGGEDVVIVTGQQDTSARDAMNQWLQEMILNDFANGMGSFSPNTSFPSGLNNEIGALSGPGNQIGSFTIDLGTADVDLSELGLDATSETTIDITITLPTDNEGQFEACFETIFGCIRIFDWP